ncbi:MAG: transcriptional regulator [Gemmatimonadales bacterium]|nr:MAG: transcriptional regulator [Gemmatimonadales bacterium]
MRDGNSATETGNYIRRGTWSNSDPALRRVRLSEGNATLGELAEPFDISRPAISKHLRVLESVGDCSSSPLRMSVSQAPSPQLSMNRAGAVA